MELILAIAALCSIHGGDVHSGTIQESQKKCQKYFVQCLQDKGLINKGLVNTVSESALAQCIKERK